MGRGAASREGRGSVVPVESSAGDHVRAADVVEDLPVEAAGIPTVAVDRGGFATYHGPGQLVGYLVIDLKQRGPVDIVRWVENGLIEALGSLGFPLVRRDTPKGASSLVGVWTEDHRKLCSIGMRIRRGRDQPRVLDQRRPGHDGLSHVHELRAARRDDGLAGRTGGRARSSGSDRRRSTGCEWRRCFVGSLRGNDVTRRPEA